MMFVLLEFNTDVDIFGMYILCTKYNITRLYNKRSVIRLICPYLKNITFSLLILRTSVLWADVSMHIVMNSISYSIIGIGPIYQCIVILCSDEYLIYSVETRCGVVVRS